MKIFENIDCIPIFSSQFSVQLALGLQIKLDFLAMNIETTNETYHFCYRSFILEGIVK